MKSCAIIPKVKGENNKIQDSRLFKDLLSFTNNNREKTKSIYYRALNNEFINDHKNSLEFDQAGEPTLKSLIKMGIGDLLSSEYIKDTISDINGFSDKGEIITKKDTTENLLDMQEKAEFFNNSSDYSDIYVAVVEKTENGEIGINLVSATDSSRELARKQSFNHRLNKKIRKYLAANNIGITALNNLDERLGRKGVADFERSRTEVEGIVNIIRIAEGTEGEKVLPEEFAHFILEALGDQPIIQRFLNLFSIKEIADTVMKDRIGYESLTDTQLANEAAAKVLSDILTGKPVDYIYNNILGRVKNAVKRKFSKLSESQLNDLIKETFEEVNSFIDNTLDNPTRHIIKFVSNTAYSNIDNKAIKLKNLLDRMMKQEIKRMEILKRSSSGTSKAYMAQQRELINILRGNLAAGQFQQGIVTYIEEMSGLLDWIKSTVFTEDTSITEIQKAANINRAADILSSYEPILKELRLLITEFDKENRDFLSQQVKDLTDAMTLKVSDYRNSLSVLAFDTFYNFISQALPEEGITIESGKRKGHIGKEELKELLKTADHDISLINTWFDSAASSTDMIIKLTDAIIRQHKNNVRNRVTEITKIIQHAARKLENSGIRNFDFMYAKDSKGNYTHQYIGIIDYAKYYENEREMYKKADELFKDNLTEKRKYISSWYFNNKTGNTPNPEIYKGKYYDLNPAQKEFYDTFMKLRNELVSYLPDNLFMEGSVTDANRVIQIRKDTMDRLFSSGNLGNILSSIWKSTKEQIQITEDETSFGEIRHALQDFAGEEVMSVPVFFTKRIDNPNDLSHDAVSTLIAFADMAVNYNEMSQIVEQLEVGKEVLQQREVVKESGGKKLITEIRGYSGTEERLPVFKNIKNFIKRYNDLIESQVYGRYMKNEGSVKLPFIDKPVSGAKAANLLIRVSSLMQIGFSPIVALSSGLTDMVNTAIEAHGGQFFSKMELLRADKLYGSELPEYLGEIGNPIKTSKLALFLEKFNVLQEYENKVRTTRFKKSAAKNLFSSNSFYFMLRMGSHFSQSRTALAQALHTKLKDKDGNIINLYDALEVKYKDPANPKYGAELVLKEGVVKEDGTELTQEDLDNFSNKILGVNQYLFGIYNSADKNAAQRTAIGRLAFMYRNWMVPALNRRFAHSDYNILLGKDTEGYYQTLFRFIVHLVSDIHNIKLSTVLRLEGMTETERANIRKALFELTTLLALTISTSVLMSDWEDKDNPWVMRMLKYFTRRLQTEVGAMTPSLGMLNEMGRLLKSPVASAQTVESTLGLMANIINPLHWGIPGVGDDYIIQSGRFKGHSRLYKSLMTNLPVNNQIYRLMNPEQSLLYFNN